MKNIMYKGNAEAEHTLVCLSASPTNAKIVKTAAKMASAFGGSFTALYVQTPDSDKMDDASKRRLQYHIRLAEKMAEKAIKYKRSMALEPMNSYERHVIHTALQNYEGVTTSSTGVEPNRRVVVSYVKPEKPDNKPKSREWA